MKKTAIVSSSVILLFTMFASQAFANGSITSTTKVTNNINVNNDTGGQSTSHSKVTITCNGQTYTYESNGESIDANPCDGSSVKINNNGAGSVQGATSVVTPNPTNIKQQLEEKKAEVKKKIDEEKAKIKATITAIPKEPTGPTINFDLGTWIRSFFASLFK